MSFSLSAHCGCNHIQLARPHITEIITYIAGFSFGASSIALFARGGGIYPSRRCGRGPGGKVEQGIPEDDPAIPPDRLQRGRQCGDLAGMALTCLRVRRFHHCAATLGLAVAVTMPERISAWRRGVPGSGGVALSLR